ncbi:hypothetical protein [Halobacillus andaensis]|uniref:hypothetical protein n=1 Tax=Halobacillus andaensis TaxID=1176239 RepID=UPI003D706A92
MEERNEEATVEPYWDTNSNPSNVSKILYWVGGLEIILGFFVALYMANESYNTEWTIFLIWLLPTMVSGLLIMGFAEVIKLLAIIKDKMDS